MAERAEGSPLSDTAVAGFDREGGGSKRESDRYDFFLPTTGRCFLLGPACYRRRRRSPKGMLRLPRECYFSGWAQVTLVIGCFALAWRQVAPSLLRVPLSPEMVLDFFWGLLGASFAIIGSLNPLSRQK